MGDIKQSMKPFLKALFTYKRQFKIIYMDGSTINMHLKGSRYHLQPVLNILQFGMNEEYSILMTYRI